MWRFACTSSRLRPDGVFETSEAAPVMSRGQLQPAPQRAPLTTRVRTRAPGFAWAMARWYVRGALPLPRYRSETTRRAEKQPPSTATTPPPTISNHAHNKQRKRQKKHTSHGDEYTYVHVHANTKLVRWCRCCTLQAGVDTVGFRRAPCVTSVGVGGLSVPKVSVSAAVRRTAWFDRP